MISVGQRQQLHPALLSFSNDELKPIRSPRPRYAIDYRSVLTTAIPPRANGTDCSLARYFQYF